MIKIITYSLLLLIGMLVSQVVDLGPIAPYLQWITFVCLAYIMIEVGLEFFIDKKNLRSYGKDYLIAATAAGFPWIFCAAFFYYVVGGGVKESLLIGRFAAPTSAGLLFAMLGAAGLGATWLFYRARILAIFDDLDTIIFMIPLQVMFVGFAIESIYLVILIFLLIFLAYRYLHAWRLPISGPWLLFYSAIIVSLSEWMEHTANVGLEVLLPAFCFGCIIYNPHDPKVKEQHQHEHAYLEHEKDWRFIDNLIKNAFMFMVGCSLPKIDFGVLSTHMLVFDVLALTLLSNIGKMFPTFCYRKEATFRERLALSIAMFPRGEVGAAVLLVAIDYGLDDTLVGLGALSLALNLLLTGFFILAVIYLIKPIHTQK